MIKTTGQKLREEGLREGLRQGLAKERQAISKALRLILHSRFQELTSEQNHLIDEANVEQLDAYLDRAFEAESVDEVLS